MRSAECPEHVGARFQRSSSAVARSSVADLEQTTDLLEMSETKESMKTPHSIQQTVHRNGNASEALTGDPKRSHGRIQRRGDPCATAQ